MNGDGKIYFRALNWVIMFVISYLNDFWVVCCGLIDFIVVLIDLSVVIQYINQGKNYYDHIPYFLCLAYC